VAAALSAVNRQVHSSSLPDRYATLFYGVFDGRTRTLTYGNAGHNPPLIVRPNGSTVRLETGGAPVGMFPDRTYEDGTVALDPGDVLAAYSDGVIETVNPAGEEWGLEGLRKAAAESGARRAEDNRNLDTLHPTEKEVSEKPRRKWDRWTAEFRQRALERMKTSRNVKALPKVLGVAPQQLYSPG
jgi:hypothetical protein